MVGLSDATGFMGNSIKGIVSGRDLLNPDAGYNAFYLYILYMIPVYSLLFILRLQPLPGSLAYPRHSPYPMRRNKL